MRALGAIELLRLGLKDVSHDFGTIVVNPRIGGRPHFLCTVPLSRSGEGKPPWLACGV